MNSTIKQAIIKSHCFNALITHDSSVRIMSYILSKANRFGYTHMTNQQLCQRLNQQYHTKVTTTSVSRITKIMAAHHIIRFVNKQIIINGYPKPQFTHTQGPNKATKIKYYNVNPTQQANKIAQKVQCHDKHIMSLIQRISLQDPQNGLFITNALNDNFRKGLRLLKAYYQGSGAYNGLKSSYKSNQVQAKKLQNRIKNTNPDKVAKSEYTEIATFMKHWGYKNALNAYYAFTKTNNPQHYQQLTPVINKKLTALCSNLRSVKQ